MNNYRPVSILSVVSKLFERLIFKHVYNFLHENSLLTKFQSGFIPGDSTVNQLAFLYHTFAKALDEKKDIRIVFCDISKAFDKVWHEGLLYKLKKIGIGGNLLNWFRNYLSNRLQRVVIRGQNSDWGTIKAGVPQGSVLGPLLFLVYINDIVCGIKSSIRLFADDTSLFLTVDEDNVNESAEQMNNDMISIKQWADQWLVNFNPAKTDNMVISNRKIDHPPLYFDNVELNNTRDHKHLGITFRDNLSWSCHVNDIATKASKMCDVLRCFKNQIDRLTLETIYFSFIRPKLEYACQVWDDCTDKDKKLLENVQLNAARIVTGAKKGTSHALIYKELNWPKLSERRTYFKLLHMHHIVNSSAPSYLCELLPSARNCTYNLRNQDNIAEFRCRTVKFSKSFLPDCIHKWNVLDNETKLINDIDKFKDRISPLSSSNPLFYFGNRRANVIHSQLRMLCSDLNSHLTALHVQDDPKCVCSYKDESTKHFLMQCPLYATERNKMMNIVNTVSSFSLNVLLYGDDNLDLELNCVIFKAVHDYIVDTGRFRI